MLRDPDALVRIVRAPGELGLARAWVSGELDVDGDLERAMALTEDWRHAPLRPADALARCAPPAASACCAGREPEPPATEARLHGRRHSAARDAEAISHHYDVSNAFYRRMLGPTMVYSCAYFASPDDTLDEAQTRKLDLVCRKLELQPGERLLDIGCGWGSLLIHAASEYGVRGVGVTVSEQQARARARADRAGGPDGPGRGAAAGLPRRRRRALRQDRQHRDVRARRAREPAGLLLAARAQLLRPGGLFLNHGIVRTAPVSTGLGSFSERYVFPDGELHTQGVVLSALEDARLEVLDDESLRPHYAETLRRWAANHDAHREAAIAEIGAERERVWRLHNVGAALGLRARVDLGPPGADDAPGGRRAAAGQGAALRA